MLNYEPLLIELMIEIKTVEIVNKLSIDLSHKVDRYKHNSSFVLSVEFNM